MFLRTLYGEEHEIFRASVRRFVEEEVVPHHEQWEKDGQVSREVWQSAGEKGFLCCSMPEEYGGGGADFLFSLVVGDEIVAPYLLHYGSEEQKKEWLPRMARGETIGAIAMTEPSAGSDLQAIKTRAVRDGNHLVINGQKVFITNGQMADLVIVVCKTGPELGAKGMSLILVERERDGFERGRNLEKIGWKAQDTSELFFNDVRVPITNLLGEEGRGFVQLIQQLPQERLLSATRSVATAEAAVEWTIEYTRERQAFGRRIADFQNTRFKLAELKTQVTVMRTFIDRCTEMHMEGGLSPEDGAMAKLHTTEVMCRVLDDCLQLHGGYGYMWEFPIARAWADNRMSRIAGGTSEIMKEIIGRDILG
jgi:acyl-CoA dehydrogenase